MKPIQVNLASYEYFDKRMAFLIMGFLGIFSVVVFISNICLSDKYSHEIANYRESLRRLEKRQAEAEKVRQLQKMAVGDEEIEATRKHTAFVNRLIARDIFPWSRILAAFEVRMPEGIFAESLVPDGNLNKIVLKGYATSMDEVSNYLKEREGAELFQKIVLLKINVAQEQPAGRNRNEKPPVKFEIESTLHPERLFPPAQYGPLWQVLKPSEKAGEEKEEEKKSGGTAS